ncbi:MAG: hypothetical protein WBP82_11160, partial [Leuconostoc mesenteroides]
MQSPLNKVPVMNGANAGGFSRRIFNLDQRQPVYFDVQHAIHARDASKLNVSVSLDNLAWNVGG